MGGMAAGGIAIALDDEGEDRRHEASIEHADNMDEVIEVSYGVSNFDQVSASGPFDLVITQGEEFAVRGEGPRWVLDQMEASVSHNRLIIERISNDFRGAWDNSGNVTFHITMPALSWLSVSGAGELSIGSIEVEDATFGISGAGSVEAAGTATNTRIAITSAGGVDAEELRSRTAAISITGAGGVNLTVDDKADINVTGGAEVNVYGSASCTINQTGFVDVNCEGAEPGVRDGERDEESLAETDEALVES